ncbi:hypothetical protein HDU67_005320 [Dinochytrium kinnereticum]|nr:hypothetical protein HDU67_005320 [Dinochytrium kinnereticum]
MVSSTLLLATAATTLLASHAIAQSVTAAPQLNLCNRNVLPAGWVPGRVTAPLVKESEFQAMNGGAALQCSGTVVVLDGCTFMVRNFTFLGAMQTRWYAGVVGKDAAGNIVENDIAVNFVVGDVIPTNGLDSQNYTLIQEPSVAYSFNSINQLRVFDLVNQQRICRAELPNQNPRVALAGAAGVTTSVALPSGTASVSAVGTGATKTGGAAGGGLGSLFAPVAGFVLAVFAL